MSEHMDESAPVKDDGWEWAIVEIFGHRQHAGRTREEERFGAKMLRVDVPTVDAAGTVQGWETIFYGGSSIFSYTPSTEAAVIKARKPWVSPYRLQAPEDPDFSEVEGSPDPQTYVPPRAPGSSDDDMPF